MSGVFSNNKHFNTFYLAGSQDLPDLERDVYTEDSTKSTVFEVYEDYLTDVADGWPEFIRDFCE